MHITQSAGTVEYTNCFTSEGYELPDECAADQSVEAIEYTDCFFADD